MKPLTPINQKPKPIVKYYATVAVIKPSGIACVLGPEFYPAAGYHHGRKCFDSFSPCRW